MSPVKKVRLPMRCLRSCLALLLVCASAGCYRASIETGAPPSSQVIDNCCAASFLAGLISPTHRQAATACEQGVARFEAGRSFSNLVWSVMTVGVYTPTSYRITCAAARSEADSLPAPSLDSLRSRIKRGGAGRAPRAPKQRAPAPSPIPGLQAP